MNTDEQRLLAAVEAGRIEVVWTRDPDGRGGYFWAIPGASVRRQRALSSLWLRGAVELGRSYSSVRKPIVLATASGREAQR
ncbi:hypothetical protein SK069_05925 [Patulibacter brassicae]|uniref:Uncharacterized protein n=1 Tax=Patulibacter brassicae TaxID=1705717 RepID=A0ABU4VH47_9ACTN|nr:hypothetical protein [Patulibacter brassicae]MDX8151123.1 hypothetical protein [Patulibacter brassicae]